MTPDQVFRNTTRLTLHLLLVVLFACTLGGGGTGHAQTAISPGETDPPTERVLPQARSEPLASPLTSALQRNLIAPFLAEPMVVDEAAVLGAPRIVAAQEGRVLLSRGDHAYARSTNGSPLVLLPEGAQRFRVFRNATALKDPSNGEVLGYEAQFIGSALLLGSEGVETELVGGQEVQRVVPAAVLITGAKEEIRAGDRLMERPPARIDALIPHPAAAGASAQIISIYGSAAIDAGPNQVIVLNRGSNDALEAGHVMAIQKRRAQAVEKIDPTRTALLLPEERNGLALVFLTFEKVAYALVVRATESVRAGDRLVAP
jgi:hypothetical protein